MYSGQLLEVRWGQRQVRVRATYVAISATTTSSHELDLFSIVHPEVSEPKVRLSFARKRFLRFNEL